MGFVVMQQEERGLNPERVVGAATVLQTEAGERLRQEVPSAESPLWSKHQKEPPEKRAKEPEWFPSESREHRAEPNRRKQTGRQVFLTSLAGPRDALLSLREHSSNRGPFFVLPSSPDVAPLGTNRMTRRPGKGHRSARTQAEQDQRRRSPAKLP
jgi:hypothetical protein